MGDIYPQCKVAAVQASSVFLDRVASVEKACRYIKEAGANGAKIIVFPECYLPGFPYWFYFYPAGDPKCIEWNRELFKNSVVVPSQETDQLCAAAKEAQAYVVMGINEKEAGTLGTMYNTQLFIHKDGYLMGKHQKLVPTFIERIVHTGGDGSTLITCDTDYGTLGGLICGENVNPLARFVLLARGESIHAASWPCLTSKAQASLESLDIRTRYYAYEGKVFVISSTWVFTEEMKDILCLSKEIRDQMVGDGGHSAIIGPDGNFISGPSQGGESIIYGTIDLERIIDAKIRHDVIGHYNRFDVFSVNFNSNKQKVLYEKKQDCEEIGAYDHEGFETDDLLD